MSDITASNTPAFSTTAQKFDHETAAFAEIWNTDKQKFLDNDMYLKKELDALDARVTALENVDNDGPTVNATFNKTNFTTDGTLTITAVVTDPAGIQKVEFYKNGLLVGTDFTSPYVYSEGITSAKNGTPVYRVLAYDALNNSTANADTTVTINIVDTGPTINFSLDDTTPSGSGQWVTYLADVTPNPHEVERVEFYHNTTLVHTLYAAPFVYAKPYFYPDSGSNSLKVKAFDIHGNVTESPALTTTLSMTDPDGAPDVDLVINGGLVGTIASGPVNMETTLSSTAGVTDLYLSYSRNYGPWTQFSHAEWPTSVNNVTVPDNMNFGLNGSYRFRATAVDTNGKITHSDGILPPSSYANTITVLKPDQAGDVRYQGTQANALAAAPGGFYKAVTLLESNLIVPAGKKLYITGDHFFRYTPNGAYLGPAEIEVAYMDFDPAGDLVRSRITVLEHNTNANTSTETTGNADILIYHNTSGADVTTNLYINIKNPQSAGGSSVKGTVKYDLKLKLTT